MITVIINDVTVLYTNFSSRSDFILYDVSNYKTYLLMRCLGPDALAGVRSSGVHMYLLELFRSSIQFYVLLSPYLCFIPFLY